MVIPEIQGLRALAALLVVLFHAKFISGGFLGVDIFYVISGYLITGLLLREITKTGKLSLSKFYIRRIKRLLPSSFVVLVTTAIVAVMVLPSTSRNELGRDIVASALYVSNYLFAHWQNDYQNLGAMPSPVIHYWSLAVEEQFYLFWPLILLIIFKFKGREWLFRAIAAIALLSFLMAISFSSTSPIWSFYSLPTRAWELGVGALLLWRPETGSTHLKRRRLLGYFCIATIVFVSFLYTSTTVFPSWAALPPVLACAGLIRYHSQLPKLISVLLSSRIAQWLGSISYPAYLWHWPVLILAPQWLGRSLSPAERGLGIVATLLLAELTHRFVEQPFRLSPASGRRTIVIAICATLSSSLLGLMILSSAPATAQGYSLKEMTAKPQIYADGCQLDKTQTISPKCEYGDAQGSKLAVLFGDSHAAQWFPTLNSISKAHHWKLVVLTKSSCPAVDVLLPDNGAFRNRPCKVWRNNSLARIAAIKPYVVFTSNFDHYQPPANIKKYSKWWADGYALLASEILHTQYLVAIADTPLPRQDMPSCLSSSAISACTALPSSPLPPLAKVQVIDPKLWFCNGNQCPAILRGVPVYRDGTHMSVKFGLALVPIFEKELVKLGLLSP